MHDTFSGPLVNLLFPPFCFGCQTAVAKEILCRRCRGELKFLKPPYCVRCGRPLEGRGGRFCGRCKNVSCAHEGIVSALAYRGPLVRLLALFKYSHYDFLSSFFASLMHRHLAEIGFSAGAYDMIVPVPLHRTKQRQREYNQSRLLAQKLSEKLDIPFRDDILSCRDYHRSQTKLDRKTRRKNVEKIFEAKKALNGNAVIILDDVVTTGATVSACSKTLQASGAGRISVLTLARAQ